jgi:hypothetical protein
MAEKEDRRKSGNPAQQEMARFGNNLSKLMGKNENNVQNDLLDSSPTYTSHCWRLGLRNVFLRKTFYDLIILTLNKGKVL